MKELFFFSVLWQCLLNSGHGQVCGLGAALLSLSISLEYTACVYVCVSCSVMSGFLLLNVHTLGRGYIGARDFDPYN